MAQNMPHHLARVSASPESHAGDENDGGGAWDRWYKGSGVVHVIPPRSAWHGGDHGDIGGGRRQLVLLAEVEDDEAELQEW